MKRSNIFTQLLLVVLCALSGTLFLDGQDSPIESNEVVVAVKNAVNEDKISNKDLGALYSIYKGSYYYASDFDFDGDVDFGQVFDKQRAIKDKVAKGVSCPKFGAYVNSVMEKYKTVAFDDKNKNKFAEEMNYISIGIKLGID